MYEEKKADTVELFLLSSLEHININEIKFSPQRRVYYVNSRYKED